MSWASLTRLTLLSYILNEIADATERDGGPEIYQVPQARANPSRQMLALGDGGGVY